MANGKEDKGMSYVRRYTKKEDRMMENEQVEEKKEIRGRKIIGVSTYLSGRDNTYVGMELPRIKLSGCDWTPVMINLFNKS